MTMKKKIFIGLGILAALAIIAVFAIVSLLGNIDPNKLLRKYSTEMTLDEEYSANFQKLPDWMGEAACTGVFKFTPEESAEYTFTAYCTENKKVEMDMYVLDEEFSELLAADNYGGDEKNYAQSDSMEGTAFLTKGQMYYVAIEGYSEDENALESFKDSFRISVTKRGDGTPAEVKAGETVRLKLNKDQQACAMFVPEEASYYDFDTMIVSKDAGVGFSSIYGITSEDGKDELVFDGICFLEAGKTYYVWVSVDESTKSTSEVELSCGKMETLTASGICSLDVSGKTVIEYTADANVPLMISSDSDGDPNVAMYDSEGFMLRQDDDSGAVVSGNPKDFALGFHAEKKKVYRICVDGEFTQCKVIIQLYKGDGSAPDSPAETEDEPQESDEAGSETEEAGE